MDEGVLVVVWGLSMIAGAFVAYKIDRSNVQLRHEIQIGIEKMASKSMPDIPDIDEIREEIEDIISNTMGQMRTPQIADHLGAILQQWAQVKLAKEMNSMELPTLPEVIPPAE